MTATKAQLKAKDKYEKKTYWKPTIRIKKEKEAIIRQFSGDSVNDFIIQAIDEKIERMKLDSEN